MHSRTSYCQSMYSCCWNSSGCERTDGIWNQVLHTNSLWSFLFQKFTKTLPFMCCQIKTFPCYCCCFLVTMCLPRTHAWGARNEYALSTLGITIVGAAITLAQGALRASTSLHHDLLMTCLQLPMSFYDTTPGGRLLNRFGKDLDTMDTVVPMNVRFWFLCTLTVVATLVVLCYSTPIFLVVVVPLAALYYFVQVLKCCCGSLSHASTVGRFCSLDLICAVVYLDISHYCG